MLVNVAAPYQSLPSGPRSSEMVFYAPAQPDFLFSQGPVQIFCQPIPRGLSLHWSLCRNLLTTPFAAGEAPFQADNSASITPSMEKLTPGFYDLHVRVMLSETQTVAGCTTFGWRAIDEPLLLNEPEDFDAFWAQAKSGLTAVPGDVRCRLAFTLRDEAIGRYNREHAALPEHYDPAGERFREVEVYKVDFASPTGGRVFGWFTKPPGSGPFPALLLLPGAGNTARPAPAEHARHGYAALDIQVHGFPVDLAQYPPLPEPSYTAPEENADYSVYLNALQAVSVLQRLPGVDAERLAVAGGSQGGRLSVVVSALDSRVRAAIPAIAHYGYRPWLQWTEQCNQAGSAGEAGFQRQEIAGDARAKVEQYFDAANFAPRIQCPVLMNMGLIDEISPATGVFAVYRQVTAPRQIVPLPNIGHDWSPAFDRYAWDWLAGILGNDKP